MYINGTSYEYVRKCNHRGSWSSRGHGTEQNLRYGGSVTEAENEFGGTIYCSGLERNKFSNSAEGWRNSPPRWKRNVIKFQLGGSVAEAEN